MDKKKKYKKVKLSIWQKKVILFLLTLIMVLLVISMLLITSRIEEYLPRNLALLFIIIYGVIGVLYGTFVMSLYEKWEDTTVIVNNFKYFHKYQFNYVYFQRFYDDLSIKLKQSSYQLKKVFKESSSEEVYIYMKNTENGILNIWLIINTDKYNKEVEKRLENYLKKFFESVYDKKRTKDSLKSHVVLCVKEYTKYFENYVKKAYIEQSNDLLFPIGIEMTRKDIYIPSTKNIHVISARDRKDYEMLKEEALIMLDIDFEEKG